jgi:hypothetical protein
MVLAISAFAQEWYSIGDDTTPFNSFFDGGKYTISGLNQNLFGYIGTGGEVEKVGLENDGSIAKNNSGRISNSYSTGNGLVENNAGAVENSYSIGCLVETNSGTVTSSYYDIDKYASCALNEYGKTTAEMKAQGTFTGWDFGTVWWIDPSINNGYPYLLAFPPKCNGIEYNPAKQKCDFGFIKTKLTSLAITITGVPETDKKPEDINISVDYPIEGIDSYIDVEWLLSGLPHTGSFSADATYTVIITLGALPEYTFEELESATINGNSIPVPANDGSKIKFEHTFPATFAASSSSEEQLYSSSSEVELSSSSSYAEQSSSSSYTELFSSSSEEKPSSSSSYTELSSSSSEEEPSSASYVEEWSSSSSEVELSSSSEEHIQIIDIVLETKDGDSKIFEKHEELSTQNKTYFTASPDLCGIDKAVVQIKDTDGSNQKINFELNPFGGLDTLVYSKDTIIAIMPVPFELMVKQKWNLLIINNNPQTNGGYRFTDFKWTKNGEETNNTSQYYYAGTGNLFNPADVFKATMNTPEGIEINTCDGNPLEYTEQQKIMMQKQVLGINGKKAEAGAEIYNSKGERSNGNKPGVYIVKEKR